MNLPISIRGARQHNLRNLDLDLPSNKLIVFSGPSGSGKSSLAFDTLFSESRRRFLDCLSARARQGMEQPEKPEVDSITGLPPALCLEQSARQQSSRTLLGSITEILDYLRILYAAAGTPHDPETGKELVRKSPDQIMPNWGVSSIRCERHVFSRLPAGCGKLRTDTECGFIHRIIAITL